MKLKILLLSLLPFSNSVFAQENATHINTFNDIYQKLKYCYTGKINGRKAGYKEISQIYEQCNTDLNKNPMKVLLKSYPVLNHLVEHIKSSYIETTPDKACKKLLEAKQEFLKIDELPLRQAEGVKFDYQSNFNITLLAIDSFYQSEYCKRYKIIKDQECQGKEVKEKPVKPSSPINEAPTEPTNKEPKKKVIKNGNLKFEVLPENAFFSNQDKKLTIYDEDPIELLRRVISLGLLNTDLFEIEEMIPGDSRIIPGVNGVPYEFRLKNANSKEVIFFEPAQYIIQDKRVENQQNSWEDYAEAIRAFKTLILNILDIYGNSAFQIYVQGSADRPTFVEKNLVAPYNTAEFQNIELVKIDKERNMPVSEIIEVGEKYDNNELPDLRGVFAKKILVLSDRIKDYPHKVTILKGNVKEYFDVSKRNCTMYIYIDWEKAKEKPIDQQQSK